MEPMTTEDYLVVMFGMLVQVLQASHALAEKINRGTGGREVSLAITKIEEAQSWLERAEKLINP